MKRQVPGFTGLSGLKAGNDREHYQKLDRVP